MRFVIAALFFTSVVTAQTVQEGRKLLLSQRYRSAKETMEKVVAAAPSNPEAIYWLAQVLFESKNTAEAKEVLRKGMEGSNGSNPLLLVAMGQAELIEKKVNDARQRFETAISLTKSKDANILSAIGKANLEDGGDYAYGIEKIKLAAALKISMIHLHTSIWGFVPQADERRRSSFFLRKRTAERSKICCGQI